eukprot:CAMPEP_0180373072 /NCGR_PEP_ID=MMETSP0989-20121125/21046_1 /TAXON_ID=697907 /ORGANISM="non described non described, Strain CCMP2293" /LENGTH=106 /DNA_ID=CAMNT_0022369915 /DNA_START=65 /DNA_END=385 /DNA_ORIENTATION=+
MVVLGWSAFLMGEVPLYRRRGCSPPLDSPGDQSVGGLDGCTPSASGASDSRKLARRIPGTSETSLSSAGSATRAVEPSPSLTDRSDRRSAASVSSKLSDWELSGEE